MQLQVRDCQFTHSCSQLLDDCCSVCVVTGALTFSKLMPVHRHSYDVHLQPSGVL